MVMKPLQLLSLKEDLTTAVRYCCLPQESWKPSQCAHLQFTWPPTPFHRCKDAECLTCQVHAIVSLVYSAQSHRWNGKEFLFFSIVLSTLLHKTRLCSNVFPTGLLVKTNHSFFFLAEFLTSVPPMDWWKWGKVANQNHKILRGSLWRIILFHRQAAGRTFSECSSSQKTLS